LQTGIQGTVGFKSQYGKNGDGSIERCGTVYHSHENGIPLAVIPESQRESKKGQSFVITRFHQVEFETLPLIVIAGERYETSECQRKGEEDLRGSIQPHLWVLQDLPLEQEVEQHICV